MKFLLDENIGKKIATFLNQQKYSTQRIRDIKPGIEDFEVLNLAVSQKAILITSDKDFGELIFKEKQPHSGVIFLRLTDQTSENKIQAIKFVLSKYKKINDKFIVVTKKENGFNLRIRYGSN